MKHQSPEELQRAAIVQPDDTSPAMSRQQRLERWADLLERDPERKLQTLPGTEYQPLSTRDTMRSSGSPVSVAFEDPVFRGLGLMGDSYGEARRFFELSDRELHRIVCYCHHGATITAGSAARFVRAAVGGGGDQSGLFARVRDAIAGSV